MIACVTMDITMRLRYFRQNINICFTLGCALCVCTNLILIENATLYGTPQKFSPFCGCEQHWYVGWLTRDFLLSGVAVTVHIL